MGIILASSSPRRRELMALITPDYTVRTSDVDERAIRAETPALLAQKLAAAKCRAAQGRELCFAATTKVVFGALSDAEIEAYIATDDPYDKAGAYGVQNGAAKFVAGIEGCYFNVMGFPVSRVYNALKELDVL